MQIRTLAVLSMFVVPLVGSCSGDPNDPMTWARKLKNVREQQEALNQLARMGVERAKVALPALIDLYKETKKPEHMDALVRYKDPSTIPLFIEAMEFTEDDFDRAIVAAGALGELKEKAVEAVPSLIKAVEHQLPIKSRANGVRLASIRALVKIGDKRAVPTLAKILTTSADEQDFLLNQKSALGLAELRDPSAIPALIKGMFMTGRGANIFQECRLGLVRMGDPAVAPMIELLNEKNAEINEIHHAVTIEIVDELAVDLGAAHGADGRGQCKLGVEPLCRRALCGAACFAAVHNDGYFFARFLFFADERNQRFRTRHTVNSLEGRLC